MSVKTEAIEKIRKAPEVKGQKETVICKPTADALCEFCNQSEEFARAVIDGKPFNECITTIAKKIGNACSDFEVFQNAVEFYFPGAKVDFVMNIRMSDYEKPATGKVINLNFSSLI